MMPETEAAAPGAALSAREREVLALLADGLTNNEIAARLVINVNTVKFHLRHAYRKIGVHSRSRAMLWWLEQDD